MGYPPEWKHDPDVEGLDCMKLAKVPYRKTWEGMEALVDAGLARNIGVCNLTVVALMELLRYCTCTYLHLQFASFHLRNHFQPLIHSTMRAFTRASTKWSYTHICSSLVWCSFALSTILSSLASPPLVRAATCSLIRPTRTRQYCVLN